MKGPYPQNSGPSQSNDWEYNEVKTITFWDFV